ncbi:hypothetical protein [Clostridium estertheticum]|uniref:hypothetical protein n=1 Tax=Clostridium estertheticum TaxID=238834 RepID=UPI001C0AA0C6|nr:hypothetical protein [Clostridium estertheticum]MBU3172763.1 hypothetical protein [Clostridium estertheticum]
MMRMMNYVLENGTEGCATDIEIKEMCVVHNTTILKQEVSSFYDCLEWSGMGVEIKEGLYILSDGIMSGEEELVLISNLVLA